jgi:hypothetical protein
MNNIFPKITAIEGGMASVTTPEFAMAENSAVVFLIPASDAPLTVSAKGYKGTDDKAIGFEMKDLAGIDWTEVESDGTEIAATEASLVAISSTFLAHDELDCVTLTVEGDTDGKTIYAFEIVTRYIPK